MKMGVHTNGSAYSQVLREAGGESLLAWIHPADRALFAASLSRVAEGGGVLDVKCRVRRPDAVEGETPFVAEMQALRHAGAAPLAGDSAAALRESEKRYRRFFEEDISGDYLATPEGTIIEANPSFAQMLGFDSVEEVLGCSIDSFYPQPEERQRLLERLRSERRIRNLDAELRRRDGTALHVIMNVIGIFDDAGELIEIQGYLVDVTKHHQLQEQLLHSQKMEAVGRLAGGIAHDFNNFLTVIQGSAEMLLADLPGGSPMREDLEEIRTASDRATLLVRQLLSFSRRQVSQSQVMDLKATVTDLEKMLRRLIGEHIRLVTRCDPRLGRIKGDASQIEQVIVNLVVNARDAMPMGGILGIEARNCDLDETEVSGYAGHLKPGPYVEIRITDTGCGMDEETLSRIFEPFFTTKGKGKGTGLGLTTVYGIVKHGGGWIWAESAPGQGSIFRVYLPRLTESAATTAQQPDDGALTVLVVDDEDSVRTLARRVLQKSGYRVLEASDADEALAIFAANEGAIQLVLTDLLLRRVSGTELASRLTARYPDLKVLYTSGLTHEMEFADDSSTGKSFMPKPFTPEELTNSVRRVLGARMLKD